MTELPTAIEIGIIPMLKEGERMIVYVEVGDVPSHIARDYVEKVKNILQDRGDFKADTIFCPTRNGVRSVVVQTEPLVAAQTDSAGYDVFT